MYHDLSQNDYDGIPIADPVDYPRFEERPIIYGRDPVQLQPVNPSPLPKEIGSAISLLKDYMKEGDAAIEKHKPKVGVNAKEFKSRA